MAESLRFSHSPTPPTDCRIFGKCQQETRNRPTVASTAAKESAAARKTTGNGSDRQAVPGRNRQAAIHRTRECAMARCPGYTDRAKKTTGRQRAAAGRLITENRSMGGKRPVVRFPAVRRSCLSESRSPVLFAGLFPRLAWRQPPIPSLWPGPSRVPCCSQSW